MATSKKPRKKYNPNTANLKVSMNSLTPFILPLQSLKSLVQRGYLGIDTIPGLDKGFYPTEYNLLVFLFKQLFTMQYATDDKDKIKFFKSVRDNIIRYFDKIINNSIYDKDTDKLVVPDKTAIPDVLKQNIIFIVDNFLLLFKNITENRMIYAIKYGSQSCLIWFGIKRDSSIQEFINLDNMFKRYFDYFGRK